MRITSYHHLPTGAEGVGLVEVDANGSRIVAPLPGISELSRDTPLSLLRRIEPDRSASIPYREIRLRRLVRQPEKIICVGLNYHDHRVESKREESAYPVLFTKFPGSLIPADQPIILPPEGDFLDWEGELAVIIGESGRRIPREQALDHVLGLSVANDVTLRDYQYRTHQWLQGKAWDAQTPVGPELVTLDEVDLGTGALRTVVNGKVEQRADLRDLIFPIPELVSTLSDFTELHPGDLILTGTPGGVGYRREPQLSLHPGDVVTVEIDGVGSITNRVEAERVSTS
jgi:acylpyruvate hydrolase